MSKTSLHSKARTFLCVANVAVLSAFFAASASAQYKDTAYVPFNVNVNATATARLDGSEERFEKFVRKDHTDTLHIITERESSTLASPGRTPNPVTMHSFRGKISLELSRQLYRGADIALYSLNGKQVLHGKAAASEAAKSISHPDVAMGVYVLSVRGVNGNAFTARLAHGGGGIDINAAFIDGNISSASRLEKAVPGNWTITVSADGHSDTSYVFIHEARIHPVHHIHLRQASHLLSSSSAEYEPSSSSSEDEASSSSSVPSSSSSIGPLSCGAVPASGYATLPITPPALTCSNGEAATGVTWYGSPSINWDNPAVGTYTITARAACGATTNLTASCPGTLNVIDKPTLSCSMPGTGVAGVAITQPNLTCSDGSMPSDIEYTGLLPDWSYPALGDYFVVAKANCGAGILEAECGDLSVEPVKLICGTMPVSGYATLPITPPSLTCSNGGTVTSIRWLGTSVVDWNNPKDGTYSNISVVANCGTAVNLMASCPGTLAVQPMISCSMASTGYEGTAITPPVLTCSDGSVPFDIDLSGYLPDWDNPAVGSYAVYAKANCGQEILPTVFCGTLAVNSVTLTCGSVPASGYEGTAISQPTLTCSHGTLGTPAWENAPNWSNPVPGTYSNISATATCGKATKTANCSGTLAVNSVTLTCGSVPTSGISGTAINPPGLTCNNGKTATNISWSASAPNWSNPALGTYSNISVTATCGTITNLTANCSGSLSVSCTAKDNTSTHYCSNGTMKAYGSLPYQGQTYKTVVIGTKTWMAENLNYDPGTGNSACYDNQASNCNKYGRLYNWSTAMNGAASSTANPSGRQGVCPSGWHLPSDAEWDALMTAVGGSNTAGTKLKATSGWNSGGNGTDDYGFSALPGGYGFSGGSFGNVGGSGYWWSATESGASSAYGRGMHYNYSNVDRNNNGKSGLYSVRCVQD